MTDNQTKEPGESGNAPAVTQQAKDEQKAAKIHTRRMSRNKLRLLQRLDPPAR